MKNSLVGMVCLTTICALLNGCDRRTINQSAFDKAKPEFKQIWEKGLTASKANDYMAANTNLVYLLRCDITPEQLVALQDALATLNERMYAAAARGDNAAQKAVETLKVTHAR